MLKRYDYLATRDGHSIESLDQGEYLPRPDPLAFHLLCVTDHVFGYQAQWAAPRLACAFGHGKPSALGCGCRRDRGGVRRFEMQQESDELRHGSALWQRLIQPLLFMARIGICMSHTLIGQPFGEAFLGTSAAKPLARRLSLTVSPSQVVEAGPPVPAHSIGI